ncbi:MAG: hypothetical protein JWQ11_1919 [Rhizobacter sp.]|nr:hypothetical protein [Rhizobacter sp.]
MGVLTDKWNGAKTKFETTTGVKKPKEVASMKLGPFVKEYEKQSGLEKAFEAVDKLIPASLESLIGKKKEKQLDEAIKELKTKAQTYGGVLNTEIAEIKKTGGKVDTIYRDLKILRSELDACTTRATLDHSKLVTFREAQEKNVSTTSAKTLMMLKSLSQSLDYNIANGTKVAQEMLKAGTAAFYNQKIQDASRNITQPLVNLIKFGMPAEMNEKAHASFKEAIADSTVYEAAHQISGAIHSLQQELLKYLKAEGSTALDANLVKLGSGSVSLDNAASKEDVVKAVKNYLLHAKSAKRLAEELARVL